MQLCIFNAAEPTRIKLTAHHTLIQKELVPHVGFTKKIKSSEMNMRESQSEKEKCVTCGDF